jgi:hypothetical protein
MEGAGEGSESRNELTAIRAQSQEALNILYG